MGSMTLSGRLLDVELPIVQAPMAGVSTTAMAAAVTGAGALGSIAVGSLTPAAADSAIAEALQAAAGPLNVNVFVHPSPPRDDHREAAWLRRLAPLFTEFGSRPPGRLEEIYRPFDAEPAMLDVLLTHRPAVVSFHFGIPAAGAIRALQRAGTILMATATSAAEARAIEAAGIDVIVAQGYEAGGHRGTFRPGPDARLSTLSLLPRIVAAVSIPVLAAGGITCGQGVRAALALGASGAQMGTAFIDCVESAASHAHRRRLQEETVTTVMTSVISGRPARGIVNRFILELGPAEHAVPAYPVAYDAARQLAAAAGEAAADFAAMWAGQGRIRYPGLSAAQLIGELRSELHSPP
jgi:nitronate monooxygenase